MTQTKYSPLEVESRWYQFWLDQHVFRSVPDEREPFCIVIPPPNVTGVLHMGHMLNNTIQDMLVRRARMLGKNACWVPGTDHASIATEAKVVAMLKEKGIEKSALSREQFLEHAWAWKEKYGGIILEQLKKLGCSCDWERTRFTMEPSLSKAVTQVFIDLYERGYIYRGARMVNWDPAGKTAVSDEEVIYKETQSRLYFIQYPIVGTEGEYITVATTRPETMLGDTAVACHPNDPRYQHLKGKSCILPIAQREIPIIFDEYIDPEFGTGCLKVTPAHDIHDYEIGLKHQLPVIDTLDENGCISKEAGHLVGMDRFVARKEIARMLESQGFLVKIEDIKNKVGHSERTNAVIEPKISTQWFVNIRKYIQDFPEVIQDVMEDKIKLHPPKYKNTYKHWMDNIQDWCISRQLWWGQQIPAWYNDEGKWVVAESEEQARKKFIEQGWQSENENFKLKQEEDVVDTWFSSWLWPISVFDGFENPENPDISYYYPTHDLVTAPEILFFWVARMIMAGRAYRNEIPFRNVYLTGIVRDKQRRKMSKSLGNSPEPLELIQKYGADGVRLGMLLCSPAGNDILFDESQVEQGRNFCNKVWNAWRLIQLLPVENEISFEPDVLDGFHTAINWFKHRFNGALIEINKAYDDYRLSEGLMTLYKLVWDDFCSWYLEMIKPSFGSALPAFVLKETRIFFENILKLMHPIMPFISEDLWHHLYPEKVQESISWESWPSPFALDSLPKELGLELITGIRAMRNSLGIPNKTHLDLFVRTQQPEQYDGWKSLVIKLGPVSSFSWSLDKLTGAYSFLAGKDEAYIPLAEQLNPEEEKVRIQNEISYLEGFLKSVEAKLNNARFMQNAKPDIVEKEQQKKKDAEVKLAALNEQMLPFITHE